VGAAIMFFIPKISSRNEEGGTQAEAFASISHWSLYEPTAANKKNKGADKSSFLLIQFKQLQYQTLISDYNCCFSSIKF
jgi:hypothetical protein